MDPILPTLVASIVGILLIAIIMHKLKQPNVVGYLIAGIILGPMGLAIVDDHQLMDRLGTFGVVMLMFFIGMEVSPEELVQKWKLAVVGIILQVFISIAVISVIGYFVDWPLIRCILLGFVISLSSTAVILNILQTRGEMQTKHGRDVLTILLAQDIAVIPMLIVLGMLGGDKISSHEITFQIIGGVFLIGLCIFIIKHPGFKIPLIGNTIRKDRELQVFGAFVLCFGLALLSGWFSLSAALGAFVAGMVVAAAKEASWVHHSLEPFKTVFVALFFVSIGMLVDMHFIASHWWQVILLTVLVLLLNTFVNALIFKIMGESWRYSLYTGAILSQIGEFSFVLVAVGASTMIIVAETYQLVIAVIALSLLLSPLWISFIKKRTLDLEALP